MTGSDDVRRRFSQVDVFGTGPFTGNPVAVVHDADGLTTDDMHRVTAWTNLSEATFLLPPSEPGADYRVRIFCPGRELPFAGHPTLGTCAAWLAAGGQPQSSGTIVQQCGAGLIELRVDDDRLGFAAPPMTRSGPIEDHLLDERLAQLEIEADEVIDAAWLDNGPGWIGLLLRSAERVLDVDVPAATIPGFDVGLIGFHDDGSDPSATDPAIEVRALFADGTGSIREDPVTGSLNAAAAQWLLASGRIEAPYRARQGTAMGRAGAVDIDLIDGTVWVSGATTVAVEGLIHW